MSRVQDVAPGQRRGGEQGDRSSEESQSPSPRFSRGGGANVCLPHPPEVCVEWGGGKSLVRAKGACRDLDFCCPQTLSHVPCLAAPSLLCPASGPSGSEGRWGEVVRGHGGFWLGRV